MFGFNRSQAQQVLDNQIELIRSLHGLTVTVELLLEDNLNVDYAKENLKVIQKKLEDADKITRAIFR